MSRIYNPWRFYSALFISMAFICIFWPPHFAIYFTMTKKWYRPFRAELERIVFLHRASPYADRCRYFVAATFKKIAGCTQEFIYLRIPMSRIYNPWRFLLSVIYLEGAYLYSLPPHCAIYPTMTKKWYRPFRTEMERHVFFHRASPYAGGYRYFVAETFKKLLVVRRSFCTCVALFKIPAAQSLRPWAKLFHSSYYNKRLLMML